MSQYIYIDYIYSPRHLRSLRENDHSIEKGTYLNIHHTYTIKFRKYAPDGVTPFYCTVLYRLIIKISRNNMKPRIKPKPPYDECKAF